MKSQSISELHKNFSKTKIYT